MNLIKLFYSYLPFFREELELKLTEANKKIDNLQEHLNKKGKFTQT